MRLTVVIYRVAVSTTSRCRNLVGPIKSILASLGALAVTHGGVLTQEYFWWSRGELNPRPTCLRFEGITTILAPREGVEPPTN